MKTIVLTLIFSVSVFARVEKPIEKGNAEQQQFDQEFAAHKNIMDQCMEGTASSDKKQGCIDNLNYFTSFCQKKDIVRFRKKFLQRQQDYFSQACEYTYKAEGQISKLFDLDEKACIPGYVTIKERLESLYKNKELLDDTAFYLYEKKSCKQYRNYVNLCVYIDGDLKAYEPRDMSLLPKVNVAQAANPGCYSSEDGLTMLTKDVSLEGESAKDSAFHQTILASRSRMPASKGATSKDCDQVRRSYIYFGCSKFEGIKDEDPIFISIEEMKQRRQQQLNGSGSGAN